MALRPGVRNVEIPLPRDFRPADSDVLLVNGQARAGVGIVNRAFARVYCNGQDPTGRTIITHRGARFFGITPPMTNVDLRLEAMDRVGIDIQVVSLSTPNIFYTDGARQPSVARMMNNAYADLVSKHPKRFKASQPARLCAKEVFGLLEELRRNARENESQVPFGTIGANSEAPATSVEVS